MPNLKLTQPQEVEVLYLLPAIRRELAVAMKKTGMEQKKIAELLCVTEPAVSQYFSSKRAQKIKFTKEILGKIQVSAEKIKNKTNLLRETQVLLNEIMNSGLTCKVHRDLAELPDECGACFKDFKNKFI